MRILDKKEIDEVCKDMTLGFYSKTLLVVDGIPMTVILVTFEMRMALNVYIAGFISGKWYYNTLWKPEENKEKEYHKYIKKVWCKRYYRMTTKNYKFEKLINGKKIADKNKKEYNAHYFLVNTFSSHKTLAALLKKSTEVKLYNWLQDNENKEFDNLKDQFIKENPEMFEE